jgi:hypothetical protein
VKIQNRAGLALADLADIEAQLANLESLSDVLRWGRQQPPGPHPAVIADVVVQDEFTHDAIVPWRDGHALVFGSTRSAPLRSPMT